MAIVYAVKAGNWSDTTVWNTGSLPTAADDVRSNGFIVTVDGSYSVNSVSNKSETGVSAGGYFDLTNGVTLTSTNGVTGGFANVGAVRCGLPVGQSATFVGNYKATVVNAYGILKTGDGSINIVGNCDNQAGTLWGLYVSGSSGGTINITGNLSGTGTLGLRLETATTLNITGNVVNLSVNMSTYACTVNIVGNVSATTSQSVIQGSNANSIVTVNGNVTDVNGYRAVATAGKLYLSGTTVTYTASSPTGQKPLYSSDQIGGNPAPANVRHGIAYGIANEITGTCYVPSPSSVAYDVPVDATVGTAVLSPANVLVALGMSSANMDSQLTAIAGQIAALPDPLARTYAQLQAYDAETAAGLLMKLNVGAPDEPIIVIPAEPPIADQCTCYLDTITLTGEQRAGVQVKFKLSTPLAIANRVVEAQTVTGETNANGRLEITLLRTDAITPTGAYYIVNSPELGIVNLPMTLETSVFSMNTWATTLLTETPA